jgi:hypothetical protein
MARTTRSGVRHCASHASRLGRFRRPEAADGLRHRRRAPLRAWAGAELSPTASPCRVETLAETGPAPSRLGPDQPGPLVACIPSRSSHLHCRINQRSNGPGPRTQPGPIPRRRPQRPRSRVARPGSGSCGGPRRRRGLTGPAGSGPGLAPTGGGMSTLQAAPPQHPASRRAAAGRGWHGAARNSTSGHTAAAPMSLGRHILPC